MAAASYTTDLTVLTLADSVTGFSEPTNSAAGGTASLESDYFIQGTNCVSKTFNATGVGGLAYTAGAAVTIPTDGAVFTWVYYACPNALGTKAAGGMQILIGNATTAYKRYYVGGSNTYTYGGWVNYPVNATVASSLNEGSPTTATQVFGYAINSVNSVTKGNPFGIDAIRYGRGTLQVTAGDLANGYGTFLGAATQNDLVANRWGILSLVDGTYKYQGHLLLGTAATAVDFRDSNKSIIIQNTEFVTSNFNLIEIRNAVSNVSLTSIAISSLSTVSRGNFLVTDNATVLLDGCTFTDMGTFSFLANTTIDSTVFRRCGLITHGNSLFTNNLVTSSYAAVALVTSNPANIQRNTFISAGTGHAIEITTPGTYNFSGNIFTGYGTAGTTNAAVYNNSGGVVTLNVTAGGSTPTIRNGTGASTTVNSNVQVTLTGLKNPSEIRVFLAGTTTEIAGTGAEAVTSGTHSFSVSSGTSMDISILALGYQNMRIKSFSITADTSVPVSQVLDRQYSN